MGDAAGDAPGCRVAVVTSGPRGIGEETILRLARVGFAVVVNYGSDQRSAESIVEAVLADHGAAVAVRADVTDELDVERLFAEMTEAFGSVDAVIHDVQGPVSAREASLGQLDAVYTASVSATILVNRAGARHVRDGGSIVNVFTSIGASALPRYGGHATISIAIEALTRELALELKAHNIGVNGISVEVDNARSASHVADVITFC